MRKRMLIALFLLSLILLFIGEFFRKPKPAVEPVVETQYKVINNKTPSEETKKTGNIHITLPESWVTLYDPAGKLTFENFTLTSIQDPDCLSGNCVNGYKKNEYYKRLGGYIFIRKAGEKINVEEFYKLPASIEDKKDCSIYFENVKMPEIKKIGRFTYKVSVFKPVCGSDVAPETNRRYEYRALTEDGYVIDVVAVFNSVDKIGALEFTRFEKSLNSLYFDPQ